MRRLTIILLAMLCALTPPAAEAVGPLVGTNCLGLLTAPTTFTDGAALVGSGGVGSWTAVTTNTDGTRAGAVTYEVWVLPAPATVPTGPPTFTTTSPTQPVTAGLTSGSYNTVVRAMTTPTAGGSTSES